MKQLLKQSGYVCETQADVWMRPGFASIAYSDGDEVEQRLAKIIGEASDISVLSDELKSHISDWPSLYHLSGTRANLLRPFEQRLTGAQVLEIGAGCGAITRYLAESGAHVLALEGSARRAAIARSRTRDLGNVAVLAERFDDFAGDAQFDVVTLIGVLEYANQFVAGDVPALTMLKRARALLKPDGVLLIAIENQLGLKYWAGAPEDHLGVPMYGIEERYRNDQPQTYGRAKLASLLAEAGFPRSDFYSPLPDYKLPVSVLTPSGLSSSDFDAAAFASQSARRDPQLPAAPSFALELAWPAIMRNRLGADLANSFLIAASNDEALEIDGAVLAYHYSTERKRRFCKQTVFRRGERGAIGVHCELLAPPTAQAQGPLLAFQLPAPIPYTLGHTLASDLVKMVSADGWTVDALGAELRRFLDIIGPIVFDGQRMPELGSAQQRLPGICFDLVPQNIVRDAEGRYHAIDLEWTLEHGMPVGWLLFRTLLLLVQGVTWFGRPGQPFVTTRRGFFLGAFRAAGFEIDAQELESFAALETAAQVEATGRQVLAVANWWGDSPLPMRSATTPTADALRALEVRVQQADASLEMTQSKLDEQTARAEQAERAALLLSERKEQEIQALEVRLREADEAAERMGRQVELLDRGMSEQTDRAVQVEHALLQSERRAAELQEQSEQSGRRAAELQEQSQHSAEARDALQRDLEQFHQASRDQMAHRDWHIAALQGSLQDMRNSTSWRITGPMRAVSRTVTKMHTGTQLVPDAIRLGGGVLPTLRRTARVLRREGVDGVRLRLANIQAKAKGAVPVGLLEGPERAPAVQQLVPWYPNPLWDAEPAMVPEWVTRFAVHCHLDTPADATACLAWLQAIAIPFDLFISIAGGQGGSALQRRFKRGLVHASAVQVTDASTAARPLTALLTHFGPAMASYPAVMHVHFNEIGRAHV